MAGDLLLKEALCCHLCDHLLGLPGPVCSQKLLSYVVLFYVLIFGCAGSWLPRGLFSSCGWQGPLSSAGHRPLVAAASLAAGHGL